MDQVIDGLQSAIAGDEQRRLWRDFARIVSEDLPVIPMYFKIDSAIFRAGVTGVRANSNDTTLPWNVYEWDIQS
jgi:ABC-type transport system substrate-binding protein